MVKAKKTVFFVMLSLTLAAIAVSLILLFVPEPKPVTITEKFYTTEGYDFELRGTIRNDSGKDLTFKRNGQQITVEMRVHDAAANYWYDTSCDIFDDDVTVKAGESYKISLPVDIRFDKIKITKVTAHLFKNDYSMDYTLYGNVINEGKFLIAAFFVGAAGFLFLVAAISSLVGNIIVAKRANRIIYDLSQRFGGGIYAAGYLGDKKQERSDATKTAFGILGAMISALFFGIGFYRNRVTKRRRNFVITPSALYEVNGKKLEYTNLMPQVQVNFANALVIEKGNKLVMNGADGRSYLAFIPEKDEKQKLIEALNALFHTEEN